MTPERWQKIEAVFQTAIDLPADQRGVFLSMECAGDDDLRREVERLLASSDSVEDFIESPIWTDSAFLNTSAKKELSDSLDGTNGDGHRDNFLGRQIGVYRLTKEIGRGGMGAVYLAERADGEFYQKVAIKLIKRGMDSDFIIRRFRHERQILASFEHPFIARLLDGGTTSDSVPYFVMEFIEGETLYNFCDMRRLGVRDRLKLFQKVCSAIEYAHSKHIIHRDIKPSNILINQSGSPKLLDFGIAKILDPNLIHESINPTASMLRMMTPDYASPEQVQGIEVTPSSDIYSLGVLLYELLTGHRPYNFAGRALHEVSHVICDILPEPPSKIIDRNENLLPQYATAKDKFLHVRGASAAQLKQELSLDIDDIIMKALSKNPADRYSSVGEFSKDISRHLSGARIEAPRFALPVRPQSDPFLKVPENSKALAVLPFKFLNLASGENTDDRFLGLGLADALITRLSKVRRFVVRPTSSILSFGEVMIDPIRAGKELNVDYILDGSIKKANNRLRVTVQLLDVADNAAIWATSIDETLSDVLTLEDTLANKVIEVLLPQLTGSELEQFAKRGTENPEAFEHYLRGRYHFNTFTEEGFAKAFVSFHSAIAADPNYAHAYAGVADYYNWLGIVGVLPPQDCFLPAIEAATKAMQLDENLSEAHASLGFSLHAGNYDWSKAECHLRRAMELNPSNANAYVWYSIVLYTEGRFPEALEFAKRSVDLDPLTPFNHHNIGWGLYYARRYEEAAERYRKVIADFPTYSFGYYGLSKIHRIVGETRAAIIENDKAKELMDGSIFSLLSEAECYAADGQTDVAREKLAKLHVMSTERYVSPYQLALVHCYLDDKEKAIESLERAFEIKEAWLNWMAVDPVFDLLRGDPRFDAILEKTGYRMFFNNFSISDTDLRAKQEQPKMVDRRELDVYNLTTLVIDGSDETDDGIPRGEPVEKKRKLVVETVAAATLLAVMAGGYFYLDRPDEAPRSVVNTAAFQNPAIVVLPFKSAVEDDRNLGVGLADALTNKLGNIKNLQVISASTGRALAANQPRKIADEIGAAFILRGDFSRTEEGVVLSAEMINAASGQTMWAEKYTALDGDLFAIQTQLAEKIWSSLNLSPMLLERQQIYKSYTKNPAAYELYLVGRYLMTNRSRENIRKAIATFSRSVAEDANFALSYVGLADAYALLNLYDIQPPPDAYTKSREYALRALQLDNDLAEAHASLAYVKFYHDRDRSGAELEFRRAIQVNPSYAQAHHWFALALTGMNEPVEALHEAHIAQRLDPRSPTIKSATGIVYFMSDRMQEALAECNKALAIDASFVPAIKVKRWVYTALGDRQSALAAFQDEMSYSGGTVDDPGWKIIELQIVDPNSDRRQNIAAIDKIVASETVGGNDFAFAYEVALAYNANGDKDRALAWLKRAGSAGSHSFNFLGVDPRLANLRTDARFQKLLATLS